MKIEYDIEIPKSVKEDINALYKFMDSDKETMAITYDDVIFAKNGATNFRRTADKEGWNIDISRTDCKVFVSKNVE